MCVCVCEEEVLHGKPHGALRPGPGTVNGRARPGRPAAGAPGHRRLGEGALPPAPCPAGGRLAAALD